MCTSSEAKSASGPEVGAREIPPLFAEQTPSTAHPERPDSRRASRPGLSLTGVRLIIPDRAMGLPVLHALSLCTCCRYYPGAADGRPRSSYSSIRVSLPRNHYLVGLHIVLFEVCSAFTHVAACTLTKFVIVIRRLQTFCLLRACPSCFRLERSPGGPYTHWKCAALSRRTWRADLRQSNDARLHGIHSQAPQLAHDILHGGRLDACGVASGDALSKRARMIRSDATTGDSAPARTCATAWFATALTSGLWRNMS